MNRRQRLSHLGLWSAYTARTRPLKGRWMPALAAALLIVGIWWAVTAAGLIGPYLLPGPGEVLGRMLDLADDVSLVEAGNWRIYDWAAVLSALLTAAHESSSLGPGVCVMRVIDDAGEDEDRHQ